MLRQVFVMCLCWYLTSTAIWAYSGGSGTADDPYQITTAEDLIALGNETGVLSYFCIFFVTDAL